MKSGLSGRWVLALRNAPDKKASVERALQKSVEAVNAALASLGEQLRPGSADKLQNAFNAALSISRAKGMYDGLIRGHQLHKSYLDLQGSDAAARTLLRRIRKYHKGDKNEELTDKRLTMAEYDALPSIHGIIPDRAMDAFECGGPAGIKHHGMWLCAGHYYAVRRASV
jgi:hypothetical protein